MALSLDTSCRPAAVAIDLSSEASSLSSAFSAVACLQGQRFRDKNTNRTEPKVDLTAVVLVLHRAKGLG